MMPTVAEILELEAFSPARVVAGRDGLDKTVSWVHNIGVPDAAQWLNGGELLLLTVNNMPQTAEAQTDYLRELIDKGVTGIILAIGRMLDHAPDAMCALANQHSFPLIEISYEARFIDLARAANEHITQANMALVKRSLHIHQTLTKLVLEGGGIRELAQTLTDLINQSISIENDRFESLASVNIAAVDEARRYTQAVGRTDSRLVQALEAEVLPEIRRTLRPVLIPQMVHVGLEMERILAPIVVHGQIYGYLWIIADERPVSELDWLAIESGATIAALMMLHEQSVQNAEATLKGNLLTRLVNGEMSGANVLTDQALRYSVDLRNPYRVLLVEYPQATSHRLIKLYNDVNHVLKTNGRTVLVGQYAGQLMLLMQSTEMLETVIADYRSVTSGEGKSRIGVSSQHHGAKQVRLAYTQAREVLDITRSLGHHGPNLYFDDLGYLHTLYHAGPKVLEGDPLAPILRGLREEQQADLFHTLEVYLDEGGNGVATAEALHIHRSTLNYRLTRIAEICHVDLSNPAIRTNLKVTLKLLRLFEVN